MTDRKATNEPGPVFIVGDKNLFVNADDMLRAQKVSDHQERLAVSEVKTQQISESIQTSENPDENLTLPKKMAIAAGR